ncbi:MAG: HD domain-containing protein [Armatimonadetes bacterium]|nr:HD domain-containing protein [Armatimonadota bacterium]
MPMPFTDKLPRPLQRAVSQVPGPVYLVGGALRDLLAGRPVHDWDVLAGDARALADAVADACASHPIPFHPDPLTLRVPCNGDTVDIVQGPPTGLKADLARRDFTVNAMALELSCGETSCDVFDPFGGLKDLRAGLLRVVSARTFADDPARVARAYRLSAELGLRLTPTTEGLLESAGPLVAKTHPQRLGAEYLRLLDARYGVAAVVNRMRKHGLLKLLLPWADAMERVGRGGFHHLPVLGHTLEALSHADRLVAAPRWLFNSAAPWLEEALTRPRARCRLRAAVLFHDVGKPVAHGRRPDGGVTFYGHEELGAEAARELMRRWAWPKPLLRSVERLVRLHMRPLTLARAAVEWDRPVSDRALRHLAKDAGEDLELLFLLAAADLLAAQGPASDPQAKLAMLRILDEMLSRSTRLSQQHQARPRLLTGHDLMRELGLAPGPLLGRVLEAVEEAIEEGRVRTKDEALALAREAAACLGPKDSQADETL